MSLLQIFNFNQEPAEEDEDDGDLSDSEDSVYSGLEDSGSDIEDEGDDEKEQGSDEDDDDDDDDDLKAKPKQGVQVGISLCAVYEESVVLLSSRTSLCLSLPADTGGSGRSEQRRRNEER